MKVYRKVYEVYEMEYIVKCMRVYREVYESVIKVYENVS